MKLCAPNLKPVNHSRLHYYINQLAREAIGKDEHDDIEPELGPTTGEQFILSTTPCRSVDRLLSLTPKRIQVHAVNTS